MCVSSRQVHGTIGPSQRTVRRFAVIALGAISDPAGSDSALRYAVKRLGHDLIARRADHAPFRINREH